MSRIWYIPLLAGIYYVTGKLGLALAFVNPSATPVWAPTGIALAAMLLLGYRVWPGIFAGAFLVNITTAGSVVTSVGIATGNTLEAMVGAYLVNRFAGGSQAFARPIDVFKFVGLAAVASTTVSATIGVTTLALDGYASWSAYPSIWVTWWLGDLVGTIVVTPLLVLWSTTVGTRWTGKRILEAALLLAVLVVVSGLVFRDQLHRGYAFMAAPPLIWIAFRLGARETATAVVLLAGIALAGTVQHYGPFGATSPEVSLLLLQAFVGFSAITALVLAAAVTDRTALEQLLRKSEAEHRAIAALTSDFAALGRVDSEGAVTLESVTEGFHFVTGYTLTELEGRGGWTALVHPEDRTTVVRVLGELAAGGEFSGDLRVVTRSGETRWLRVFARALLEADGDRRVLAAAQDISDRKRSQEQLQKHQSVIRALSTPVLRLLERLLILPVIGDVDTSRAHQLTKQLVEGVRTHRARAVVIDLTGVAEVEPEAADLLVQAVETTRLMGATAILSGVSAALAHRLVAVGIDLERFRTAGDLQAGVDEAQRLLASDATRTAARDRSGGGRPWSPSSTP